MKYLNLLIFIIPLELWTISHKVLGYKTAQESSCLGAGTAKYDPTNPYNDGFTSPSLRDEGFQFTVGSHNFHKMNWSNWEFYHHYAYSSVERKRALAFHVSAYPIKIDNKFMRGWYHVVITANLTIRSLLVNGVDGDGVPVGEFVHDFPKCTDHSEEHNDLPWQGFVPCNVVSNIEPTANWGFMYVANPIQTPEYVPKGPKTEFHLNFRRSTNACNQAQNLRFVAVANLDSIAWYSPDLANSDTVVHHKKTVIIGAPDPIPLPGTYDPTTVKCHERDKLPDYIQEIKTIGEAPGRTPCTVLKLKARKTYLPPSDPPSTAEEQALFSGRCIAYIDANYKVIVTGFNFTRVHDCTENRMNMTYNKSYSKYSTYIEKNVTERIKTGDCPKEAPCVSIPPRPSTTLPPTIPTTTTLKPTTTTPHTTTPKVIRSVYSIVRAPGLEIWDTRVLHGMVMTILVFFVSPVNIFMTRYYKETFMSSRVMFLRIWYWLHHVSIAVSILLHLAGIVRMIMRRVVSGVSLSLAGKLHRYIGWGSMGLMLLLSVLGGFRSMNRCGRGFCICMHWFFGTLIHLTNYALVILSIGIPGSPSATHDVSLHGVFPLHKGEEVLRIAILWIATDLVMHVAMHVHLCIIDDKVGLDPPRCNFPTPLPAIPEHATADLPGSLFRRLMLVAYCCGALVVTIYICVILYSQDPFDGRELGEMSCTHSNNWKDLTKLHQSCENNNLFIGTF